MAPFEATSYRDPENLSRRVCPPYDVISEQERFLLERADPYNFVRLILPQGKGGDGAESSDRYTAAAKTLADWMDEGILSAVHQDRYFAYRMQYAVAGTPRETQGLICALELSNLDQGDVLPHENTTPGPKADRLELTRHTKANLEPLWFVSAKPCPGIQDVYQQIEKAMGSTTDSDGVVHTIWPIRPDPSPDPKSLLADIPLVIADGHHRYETAIAYRDERRKDSGPGPWDFAIALITDPDHQPPALLSIHRVLEGASSEDLSIHTDLEPFDGDLAALSKTVSKAGPGMVGVADSNQLWMIRNEGTELDTELVQNLAGKAGGKLRYEHRVDDVARAVGNGAIGLLMAPVQLKTVIERALRGERMPPKTTLFWPKPRSGFVFRDLRGSRVKK